MFPEDDEASQFDLDIHAIVELAGTGEIAVVEPSRLGADLRASHGPRTGRLASNLDEARRLDFVADVERVVGLGDRLVTSRPRGERLGRRVGDPSPSLPRASVSTRSPHKSPSASSPRSPRDRHRGTRAGWPSGRGAGPSRRSRSRASQRHPIGGRCRLSLRRPRGERVLLWAAGSGLGGTGLDDSDSERLGGGGLARLGMASRTIVSIHTVRRRPRLGGGGDSPRPRGRRVLRRRPPLGVAALAPGAPAHHAARRRLRPRPLGVAHAAVVDKANSLSASIAAVREPRGVVPDRQRTGPESSGP